MISQVNPLKTAGASAGGRIVSDRPQGYEPESPWEAAQVTRRLRILYVPPNHLVITIVSIRCN